MFLGSFQGYSLNLGITGKVFFDSLKDLTPNNDLADVFFEIEVASLEHVHFVVDLEGVVVEDSLLGFIFLIVN